jgi:pantothenate kinase
LTISPALCRYSLRLGEKRTATQRRALRHGYRGRMPGAVRLRAEDLIGRLRGLPRPRGRALVGIVGAPGSGKSTLAAALVATLGPKAALVGMDGFHLGQAELVRLGRADRKGAPDTFDAWGYAALLRRLRANSDPVIYAPLFRRDLEEPIAGCVRTVKSAAWVLTEGNYLLHEDDGWVAVRAELDEVWYLDVPDGIRQERLVRRRLSFGADLDEARRWTLGSDERNAAVVAATRCRADLIVDLIAE